MNTPDLFKDTRKRIGFNQDQMAAMLGYDRKNTVSDIENGRAEPNKQAMLTVAMIRACLSAKAV